MVWSLVQKNHQKLHMACQEYLFICLSYIDIGRYIIYILNWGCVGRYSIFQLRCPWVWSQIRIQLPVSVCFRCIMKDGNIFVWGARFFHRFGMCSYSSSLAGRSCWEEGARRYLGEVYELFKECCSSSKAKLSSVINSFRVTHRATKSQWRMYYSQCSTVTLIYFSQEKLKLHFRKLKVLIKCLSISNVI